MDPKVVHGHGDGDADLSFEALTFGEDSGHVQKDMKSAKKKTFKKEKSPQEEKDKNASVYVSTKDETEKIDVQSLLKKLEQFGVVKASYFKEKQNFGFIQFLDSSVVDVVVDAINKNSLFLADGVHISAERGSSKGSSLGTSLGTSMGTSFALPSSSLPSSSSFPFSSTPSTPSTPSIPTSAPSTPRENSSSSSTSNLTSPVLEKPDTILVLKNLPFSLKQDQLQEILIHVNSSPPQSINLHFDNMGVFRGMAFIKYRLLEDAIKVFEALNGYDVGGRKVRVEYKRKNKGQQADIPTEWQEEEDLKKLWEQVRDFSNNPNVNEISFTPNLSSNQRKHIHTMAEKLKLTHYSNGEADQRYICIKKAPPTPTTPSSSSSSSSSSFHVVPTLVVPSNQNGFALPLPSSADRGIDIKGRRPRRDSENNTPRGHNMLMGTSPRERERESSSVPVGSVEKDTYRPRGNSLFKKDFGSTPSDNVDWRISSPRGIEQGSPSVTGLVIAPSRQPKGPDGSKGFSDLYRNARKHACTFVPLDSSAPEIPAVV